MSDSKRVTIRDISERLGISVTTVYKALNNKPKVGNELREKIIKAAEEMNYVPNRVAQALARDVLSIAAIIPRHPPQFMKYVEGGVREALDELRDFNVTGIVEVVDDAEDTKRAWKELYKRNVSGIVSCFNQYNNGISEIIHDMQGFNIPVVAISTSPIDNMHCIGEVVSNGDVLGRMAGQFLRMISGPDTPVVCMIPDLSVNIHVKCVQAFKDECAIRGLDFKGLFFSGYEYEETYRMTQKMLDLKLDIEGIYVGSANAYPVCQCVKDYGLTKKVNIIGQDLYPELAQCIKEGMLTASLFQNQYENAKRSVKTLFHYLSDPQGGFRSSYYRPELILQANLDIYDGMY